MALHIVLVEPEIPPNTGNISRTCAATGTVLHLVKPLGFSIDDRQLKRAGLDYWPFVKLVLHEDLAAFLREWGERRMFLATTKGVQSYTDVRYQDEDMLVFGKETKGLPAELIQDRQADTIRIPMSQDTRLRSINLSNAAGIVLYEALRQLDFPKLK
ncbi:MAG TPA: tRNA (uridine(34)/cytosine(34)/5-carboxymethylaminomethyluridine(34)-2'-O)-methyltransferase TrmL [Clostridiales bacterium]|nr:tRNA (uridine(34)/cytosine(34)/5-carboxymethylaminomethyluridine(34)-2'-O)-methyltransferase TrmL [Clostridiales bacterium]